jgi:Rrf2 family protein
MKLSTKTTYGLRALLRLASTDNDKPLSITQIANIEDLSPAYLERIMSSLKKAKLVKAEKGVSGGYSLMGNPDNISALMIMNALEKNKNLFQCIKKTETGNCSSSCSCQADLALLSIENRIQKTLASINLRDLVEIKQNEKNPN